jgi:biopolymer transport protein ExbD
VRGVTGGPNFYGIITLCHLISKSTFFMAELNTPAGKPSKRGGRRCRKLSTRVDMTPMVDLGFLLITFFVFTTTMSRPKALEVRKPADGDPTKTGANATLTLVALGDNKVFYYNGEFSEALHNGSYGTARYGRNGGIGDVIRDKQAAMDRYYKGGRKEMMLLIKPSSESSYGNVVSLLDETLINDVKRYALVELTPEEKSGISSKNL